MPLRSKAPETSLMRKRVFKCLRVLCTKITMNCSMVFINMFLCTHVPMNFSYMVTGSTERYFDIVADTWSPT